MGKRIINVRSGANGTGTLSTAMRERTIRPASISSANESAISVTTKPLNTRFCDRPLDDRELWAIGMMIECQADEFGVLSRLVTLAVEIAFEVNDLTGLRAAQFDAVMSYLAHLPGHRS